MTHRLLYIIYIVHNFDYYKSIIMTSNECIDALEHKKERWGKVVREKGRIKADLEINKIKRLKEKRKTQR